MGPLAATPGGTSRPVRQGMPGGPWPVPSCNVGAWRYARWTGARLRGGNARWQAHSTSWSCDPSCWRETRWATPRSGRCTCIDRPARRSRFRPVYMLQGFGGRLAEWLEPAASGQTTIERLDAMFSCGESPALIVFVDCSTSWGGSQFLNSTSTGRVCSTIWRLVPFVDARYPTLSARRAPRGVRVALRRLWRNRDLDGKALIPFDSVGRPVEEVWSRWLARDPVRMARQHAEALAGMRAIYLGAGLQDDFFLDLGACALSDELTRLGIAHSLELFDGDHDAVDERIPAATCALARALSPVPASG